MPIIDSSHPLFAHAKQMRGMHMRDLFAQDSKRFQKYHLQHKGLLLDYSKNLLVDETLSGLFELLQQCDFKPQCEALFAGKNVNHTEQKPALHMALRDAGNHFPADILADIKQLHEKMADLQQIIAQQHQQENFDLPDTTSDAPITDIVNIGIGGSELGPQMAYHALTPFRQENLTCHFVSSIDGANLNDVWNNINPAQTLFLIVSKSFSTDETLHNALSLKKLLHKHHPELDIKKHLFAITAKAERAIDFGVSPKNILPIWDWVGGRTSLCSGVGLALYCTIGKQHFDELLRGAYDMDRHFYDSPPTQNLPVLLALSHIWNRNFLGTIAHGIIPYDYRLRFFPDYLQQLLMESCGKSIDKDGQNIFLKTAPIYWGASGNNAQHSFFQMLHQGSDIIPLDFLLGKQAVDGINQGDNSHHQKLIANCLAQAESMMMGKNEPSLPAWQQFAGNRPSNMIIYPSLTPYYLGMLMSLYEHMTFTQSVIWQINPFDQFGVELGKNNTQKLLSMLQNNDDGDIALDASTSELLKHLRDSPS